MSRQHMTIAVSEEKRAELMKAYAQYNATADVKVSFSAFIRAAMEKGAAELLTEKNKQQ